MTRRAIADVGPAATVTGAAAATLIMLAIGWREIVFLQVLWPGLALGLVPMLYQASKQNRALKQLLIKELTAPYGPRR